MTIKNLIRQFIKEMIAEGLTVDPLDYRQRGVVPQLVRDTSPGGVGFTIPGTRPSIEQQNRKERAADRLIFDYTVPYIKNIKLNIQRVNNAGKTTSVIRDLPVSSIFSVEFDDRELRTQTLKAIKQFATDYPDQIADVLESAATFAVDSLMFLPSGEGGLLPNVIVTPESSSTLAKQFAKIVSKKYNAAYAELEIDLEARHVEDVIKKNRNLVANDVLMRLKTLKDGNYEESTPAQRDAYRKLSDDVRRMITTANNRIRRAVLEDPNYMPSWSSLLDKRLSAYVIGGFDFNKPKSVVLPSGEISPERSTATIAIKNFVDANGRIEEMQMGELTELNVLIVDELVSYGMTFREVARTLYAAGANNVAGLTIWKNSGSRKTPAAQQQQQQQAPVQAPAVPAFQKADADDIEDLANLIVRNKKLPTLTWAKIYAKDWEIEITDQQAEEVVARAKELSGK